MEVYLKNKKKNIALHLFGGDDIAGDLLIYPLIKLTNNIVEDTLLKYGEGYVFVSVVYNALLLDLYVEKKYVIKADKIIRRYIKTAQSNSVVHQKSTFDILKFPANISIKHLINLIKTK